MKPEMLVEKLLEGSKELNRIAEELALIVGMLISFIDQCPEVQRFLFPGNSVHTQVGRWDISVHDGRIQIFFCILGIQVFKRSSDGEKFSKVEYAQMTHSALPTLVAEMFKTYPQLAERAQPILVAAQHT